MIGLYILTSPYLINDKVFKFGMSMRLHERWYDYYDTFHDAYYVYNFSILNLKSDNHIKYLEKVILNDTKKYHKKYLGNEYRDINKISLDDFKNIIINVLTRYKVKYEIILNPKYKKPIRSIKENTNIIPIEFNIELNNTELNNIELFDYQKKCKVDTINYFKNNDKGIINWCCGLGKTILGCSISKSYVNNYLLLGVYNLCLIVQWIKDLILFYDLPILIIGSINKNDIITSLPELNNYYITTNNININNWLIKNKKGIIITSYQSSHKLLNNNILFDFGIFDECHHLTCIIEEDKNKNTDILKLNIKKQLGLTATIKTLDTDKNKIDNLDYFINIIDNKSVLWAIENKKITDYDISFPKIELEKLEEIIENNLNKNISKNDYYFYLSAYISLMSIKEYNRKKILIFANKIEDTCKIYNYIKLINKSYFQINLDLLEHTNDDKSLSHKIKSFENCNIGILINVYKIGEGINIKSLDTVLFSDNMNSSIRITQSALRANRLDNNNINKKARIIIPMIYEEDENYITEEDDLKIKTFSIIKQIITEFGISDKNIINKLKIDNISEVNGNSNNIKHKYVFKEDIEFYNKFKLKIIQREYLGKKTYPYIKKKIKELNGRDNYNISLEEDYRINKQLKEGLPDINWIKEYLIKNNKNWFDLYEIDTSKYISWETFYKKYYNTKEKLYVKNSEDIPHIVDLEELYKPNYNKRRFWYNFVPPKRILKICLDNL